jgi:predicted enzyme related to lactoylglutathione lyase
MREGMKEMGGPDGFEDVVAGIVVLGNDQPDTPAHWSVTFAVDDADAIAARVEELGGRVLMPPTDAPWVRMSLLADPAGATFFANQFVPENKGLGAETVA